jgi:hypothetical protein
MDEVQRKNMNNKSGIGRVLWIRHAVNKIPAFCDPVPGPSYYMSKERAWLKSISISRKALDTYFVKVSVAANTLGINHSSVLSALRNGRMGRPLYDYSRCSDVGSYDLWVHRVALARYARTRQRRKR